MRQSLATCRANMLNFLDSTPEIANDHVRVKSRLSLSLFSLARSLSHYLSVALPPCFSLFASRLLSLLLSPSLSRSSHCLFSHCELFLFSCFRFLRRSLILTLFLLSHSLFLFPPPLLFLFSLFYSLFHISLSLVTFTVARCLRFSFLFVFLILSVLLFLPPFSPTISPCLCASRTPRRDICAQHSRTKAATSC